MPMRSTVPQRMLVVAVVAIVAVVAVLTVHVAGRTPTPPAEDRTGGGVGDRHRPASALATVLAARAQSPVGSVGIGIDPADPLDEPPWTSWPTARVHPSELRPGGPPPDGIPPIDDPVLIPAAAADFLAPTDPVVTIEINGDARAYPLQILLWHEIVNDVIGGVPTTITYCPLCNSALAYERTVHTFTHPTTQQTTGSATEQVTEQVLDFGTSGLLLHSSLVMYDRQTETLWSHYTAEGIIGALAGVRLRTRPVAIVPFDLWQQAHPTGLVLSQDTGHVRDYGLTPYPGYDNEGSTPFLFQGDIDGRLAPMTRIVGIMPDQARADHAVAVPLVTLRDRRVIATEVGGRPIVVWWVPGANSVLSTHDIVVAKDVGSVGVFSATLEGRTLEFVAMDATLDPVANTAAEIAADTSDSTPARGFRDLETGSIWDHLGRAVSGPLRGHSLEPVTHLDTFWFAWAAFWPDTEILTSSR